MRWLFLNLILFSFLSTQIHGLSHDHISETSTSHECSYCETYNHSPGLVSKPLQVELWITQGSQDYFLKDQFRPTVSLCSTISPRGPPAFII